MITIIILISSALLISSCNSPTVKGHVFSCVTSKEKQICRCGFRIIDYKQDREIVGEWENTSINETMPLDQCPDLVGFGLEDWLTKIKPKMKEGHDYYEDYSKKKQKHFNQ